MWNGQYHEKPKGWGIAQVCLNGHVRSRNIREYQSWGETYCSECGAQTIQECPACHKPLRGANLDVLRLITSDEKFAAYCHECGAAFPWTTSRVEAATELLRESELSQSDQIQLVAVLPDLLTDTPRTQVAIARYQRIIKNAGKAIQSGMRDILIDIASEAVKKTIWG